MKICDKCGKNIANVSYSENLNGHIQHINLCKECAIKMGILEDQSGITFGDVINTFMGGSMQNFPSSQRCPKCGMRLKDIERTGYLGCSQCYETFMRYIKDMVGRFQPRVKHTGKIPNLDNSNVETSKKTNVEQKKTVSIEELKGQLNELVENQKYEEAAVLRDEILKLTKEEKKNDK